MSDGRAAIFVSIRWAARAPLLLSACGTLAIAYTWPLVLRPASTILGAGAGDNVTFLWNFWWMRAALRRGQDFFECPAIFAPWVGGTVNGVTYAALFPEGTLTFSGPTFVAPEFRPGLPISPQGPFSFHGNVSVFTDESQTGPPVFSSALTGRGITTVFGFVPSPGAPFVLEPGDDVHYTFDSAIPEPSSLVMFGSGLIGAAVRWRRRRDRRPVC